MRNLAIVLSAAALVALIIVGLVWQHRLVAGLPPRVECADAAAALAAAYAEADKQGGSVLSVLGTGSMAPFIPAASHEPRKTIVAYVVTLPGATYSDIRRGSLVLYFPEFASEALYIHQAAEHDAAGWIMTGLHNERSEAAWRVTPANFVALAAHVFTWPQG